jgi:hypothetical protein
VLYANDYVENTAETEMKPGLQGSSLFLPAQHGGKQGAVKVSATIRPIFGDS